MVLYPEREFLVNEHFWNIIVRKYFYGEKLLTYFVIKVLRVKTIKCEETKTLVVNLSTTRRPRVRKVVYLRDKTKGPLSSEVLFLLVSLGTYKLFLIIDLKICYNIVVRNYFILPSLKKFISDTCERNNRKPRLILWKRPTPYSSLIWLSR